MKKSQSKHSNENAIVKQILVWCFGTGTFLTIIVVINSCYLKSPLNVELIGRIWGIFTPIIMFVLGHSFGNRHI
jgi:hypothetical protein